MASIFREHLLHGKVAAFVTGGGSGIGQRMAERFAEHGAKVVLVGRKQEKLDAAAVSIRSAGGFAETAALDVRDYPAVEAAIKKTRDELGEIDILLCGAAGNFHAPVTRHAVREWLQIGNRHRPFRHLQHLPRRLRIACANPAPRLISYFRRLMPTYRDRASGARLRRQSRHRTIS